MMKKFFYLLGGVMLMAAFTTAVAQQQLIYFPEKTVFNVWDSPPGPGKAPPPLIHAIMYKDTVTFYCENWGQNPEKTCLHLAAVIRPPRQPGKCSCQDMIITSKGNGIFELFSKQDNLSASFKTIRVEDKFLKLINTAKNKQLFLRRSEPK